MTYSLTVVVLSGPIAVGKTTLAMDLVRCSSAKHISTSELISAEAGRALGRVELQHRGNSSRLLGAHWIIDAMQRVTRDDPLGGVVVVDAARTTGQVQGLRAAAAGTWKVLHVHLTGDNAALEVRHEAFRTGTEISWAQAMGSPTEAAESSLAAEADVVVDTTRITAADVTAIVMARLSRSVPTQGTYADVLVGGQWGSEGKGNLAFFLAPEYDLLVRVGAPNAGHKVRDYAGAVYTHRQLPSGTRATSCALLLGPGAVINVEVLMREIAECAVMPGRLAIDPAALIIEEDDVAHESRLKVAIGSTGTGGGAALARRIRQRDTSGAIRTACDIPKLAPYIRESASVLDEIVSRGGRIFIEGTQGTGLSILHGSFPHVTSRDTTVGTLLADVGISPLLLRRVIMAVRTYPIRVGGQSGPMGREITWETVAERSGLSADEIKKVELGSVSGNARRVAEFSWSQLRRSACLNGATDIALTFADYIDVNNRAARRINQLSDATIRFISEIETVAAAPVSLISTSFDGRGPIDRRLW